MELIDGCWKYPDPIRLISVTAIHLTPEAEAYEQVDLLGAREAVGSAKQEKIERAMDLIRGKFGSEAITYGSTGGKVLSDKHSDG